MAKQPRQHWLLFLLLSCLFAATSVASRADSLTWNAASSRFNARIESWNLQRTLREVSRQTGWDIYVEPSLDRNVKVKFKNLPTGEALRLLLGDLNFALVPQKNASSRLLVYRTSVGEAVQLIAGKSGNSGGSRSVIPNELIITLKPGSKESAEEIAKRLGAKVVGSIDGANGYRLQFDDEAAAAKARESLEEMDSIAGVDSNYRISSPGQIDSLQVSSGALPFNLKPKVSTDGSQTIVGLIDTAVQPLGNGMDQFLLPTIHVAGDPAPNADQISHGTSMANTLLHSLSQSSSEGGGSSVRVLPVDVYGSNSEANTFDVARGIYAAIEGGATIINLSLGGDGESTFLSNLIQNSYKDGVLFFGAAGNTPTTSPTYPAAYPEVVAVTAADRKGSLAPYANRGDFVDVIAPGMSVVDYNGQTFIVSGTSASTAYVSGAAAAVKAGGKSASEVENYMRHSLGVRSPAKP